MQADARDGVEVGQHVERGTGGNYADISTPASLFSLPDPFTVIPDLGVGAVQGATAALVDLGYLPQSALPTTYPYAPSLAPHVNFFVGQPSVTGLSVLSGAVGPFLHLIPPATDLLAL